MLRQKCPVCPWTVSNSWSRTASQMRTVPSQRDEATRAAIRAEGHAADFGGVALAVVQHLGSRDVPDSYATVVADAGQVHAVGAVGYPPDRRVTARQRPQFSTVGHVPDTHAAIPACRGELFTVGSTGHAADMVAVTAQVNSNSPFSASHTRAVPSAPPVTSRLPRGLNTAAQTVPVCPVNADCGLPLDVSHKSGGGIWVGGGATFILDADTAVSGNSAPVDPNISYN